MQKNRIGVFFSQSKSDEEIKTLVDLRKQTVTFKSLECHKNSWKNGISGILKKNETTKIQIRLINSKAQYKNWRGIWYMM